MLPDYIDVKKQLQEFLLHWLNKRIREYQGPFADIPRQKIFEGDSSFIIRPDDQQEAIDWRLLKSDLAIKVEEVPNLTLSMILSKLDKVAYEMAGSMTKTIYETISNETERIGNIIKNTGKISPEAILKVLEKIEITFNEDGTPEMPSIHAHPDQAATLNEALDKLKNVKKYQKRFNEIISKKKRQWRVREADRNLVG